MSPITNDPKPRKTRLLPKLMFHPLPLDHQIPAVEVGLDRSHRVSRLAGYDERRFVSAPEHHIDRTLDDEIADRLERSFLLDIVLSVPRSSPFGCSSRMGGRCPSGTILLMRCDMTSIVVIYIESVKQNVQLNYTLTGCQGKPYESVRIETRLQFLDMCRARP